MLTPRPITVVGSINVDLTATVGRLPQAGETVGGGELSRGPGGKGANQAIAASRLGASTRMVGMVGNDPEGTWMRRVLTEAGVDTQEISISEKPTGVALIAVDAEAENQIVVCPGANSDVEVKTTSFRSDEIVLTQLEIPMHVIDDLAACVRGYFVVNAAPAQRLSKAVIERADLIIVNEPEYALQPELVAARHVAVTYGSRGAALLDGGREMVRVPSPKVRAVSTVGAGDAFCAALALTLGSELAAEAALATACAVGAAAVTFPESQPALRPLGAYEPR